MNKIEELTKELTDLTSSQLTVISGLIEEVERLKAEKESGNNIVLSRDIKEWEWYTDNNTKSLFLHLLLSINAETIEADGIIVNPGSVLITYSTLSTETGLSIGEIRTAIRKLQRTGYILKKKEGQKIIYTIKNYEKYIQ